MIWNEIRPVDRYRVKVSDSISVSQLKTLSHLYQPLLGSIAYSLYMTLINDVEGDGPLSSINTHRWLMSVTSETLDRLYRARLRLEALGLLQVYILQEPHEDEEVDRQAEDQLLLEYHLHPPLSPSRFFSDDVLNICLYNQVGTRQYKDLRARFSSAGDDQKRKKKEEITKEFHEVFTSFHPTELVAMEGSEIQREFHMIDQAYPIESTPQGVIKNEPGYERYPLRVETLRHFFMKGIDAERILTPRNMETIKKLAFFYQLDEWSLSRIIQDSLTLEDELDIDVLRQKTKEWYRLETGGEPPKVVHLVQPASERVISADADSEEERHLHTLESMSPIQLLEAYQGGGKIAEADMKLVEELIFDYQLYPGVVNLLIEYILLTNQFKLPRNLVTKVAAHWKRTNITNVKQAQELAKKEHQQYKQWKEPKQSGTPSQHVKPNQHKKTQQQTQQQKRRAGGQSAVRKDVLPDWIKQQTQKEEYSSSDNNQPISDQQKRKRIESLLKELGEWDQKGGEA